jgi:dienelactone hydrolase
VIDRAKLLELLGPFPERVPLEPRRLEVVDCGSYLREKVEYSTELNERVSAYLCVPKQLTAQSAAVFCHHQHNFEFTLGKSEVVGLAGNPDQAYAAELAERGYITFAPDAIGFEERNWSGGTFEASYYELASRLVRGHTLLAKVLHDASVGIDYLASRSEVTRTEGAWPSG